MMPCTGDDVWCLCLLPVRTLGALGTVGLIENRHILRQTGEGVDDEGFDLGKLERAVAVAGQYDDVVAAGAVLALRNSSLLAGNNRDLLSLLNVVVVFLVAILRLSFFE